MYSDFGKPLQITEITIPSYSWEQDDEEMQAVIIEKLYSLWFSHPNVEQIIYWNMVDGYAHVWDSDPIKIAESRGDMTMGENIYYGGLLRFDMTPKPSYNKIKELITKRWHTQNSLVSDDDGSATFRGFYGDYDVRVEINGRTVEKTISLSKGKTSEFIIEV